MNKEPWWWTEMPHHPMGNKFKKQGAIRGPHKRNQSLAAVEERVHLSHWLLIVDIISTQIEASIYVVVEVCPPKTCNHLEHGICHSVILEINS